MSREAGEALNAEAAANTAAIVEPPRVSNKVKYRQILVSLRILIGCFCFFLNFRKLTDFWIVLCYSMNVCWGMKTLGGGWGTQTLNAKVKFMWTFLYSHSGGVPQNHPWGLMHAHLLKLSQHFIYRVFFSDISFLPPANDVWGKVLFLHEFVCSQGVSVLGCAYVKETREVSVQEFFVRETPGGLCPGIYNSNSGKVESQVSDFYGIFKDFMRAPFPREICWILNICVTCQVFGGVLLGSGKNNRTYWC